MFELSATQKQLQATAREFAKKEIAPRAAEIDRSEQYPWENVDLLTKQGFMGMTVPQKYGGPGMSYLDVVLVIEEIAKACGVSARIVVEGNMGAVGAVMKFGSDLQKKIAAEHVLSGDKPAICITEPGAGSAATEMTTRADRKGDRYIINGTKHWITGGGVSRFHLIFARVFENNEPQGIAGFIALRGADGLKVGMREPAMGLRGIPETQIIFEDLEVPQEMVLIPPEGLRHGFAGLMNAYNGQRVGAGTVALGIATGAYELALEYSQQREQFGRLIGSFQAVKHMCAEVIAEIDPLEAKNEASLRAREDGRFSIERAGEITFTNQLSGRSPRLREFCSGEIFRDLAHDLLGPNVHLYVDQSVYKKPGTEQNFPWHQDNGYQYIEPQHYLTGAQHVQVARGVMRTGAWAMNLEEHVG